MPATSVSPLNQNIVVTLPSRGWFDPADHASAAARRSPAARRLLPRHAHGRRRIPAQACAVKRPLPEDQGPSPPRYHKKHALAALVPKCERRARADKRRGRNTMAMRPFSPGWAQLSPASAPREMPRRRPAAVVETPGDVFTDKRCRAGGGLVAPSLVDGIYQLHTRARGQAPRGRST